MAKRGRPAKQARPEPEVATAVLETPTPEITESEEDFLKMIQVGVSGMTPEAQVLGAKSGYVYRQVRINNVDINRAKGYEPVTDEKLQGPYSIADGTRHGDTILMRCRKEIVDARNKLRASLSAERIKKIKEETPRGAGIVGGKVNMVERRTG